MINRKNKLRLDDIIIHRLKKNDKVLSCGVGDGSEIKYLREKNIKAYGVDPSRIDDSKIKGVTKYIKKAEIKPKIFGNLKFDLIYAFEVLEHVGCRNYGTILEKNFNQKRKYFVNSIISNLKKGGICIITTGNKNCILDPGHSHAYNNLGKFLKLFTSKFGISIPFDKKNFLPNANQIIKILDSIGEKKKISYKFIDMSNYPEIVKKKKFISKIIKYMLKFSNVYLFRKSFMNPILGIEIKLR